MSPAFSKKIDLKLEKIQASEVLAAGDAPPMARIDCLERLAPGKSLTADGRMKQLRGLPSFRLTGGGLPEDCLDYGYVVLRKEHCSGANKEILDKGCILDQAGRPTLLFARRDIYPIKAEPAEGS